MVLTEVEVDGQNTWRILLKKVSRMENAAGEYRIEEPISLREYRAQLQADQERKKKARKEYLKELQKRLDNIKAEHLKIKGPGCQCTRCTYTIPQE